MTDPMNHDYVNNSWTRPCLAISLWGILSLLNLFSSLTKEKKYSILNIENICMLPNIILNIPGAWVTGLVGAVGPPGSAENGLGSQVTSGLGADTPSPSLLQGATILHMEEKETAWEG